MNEMPQAFMSTIRKAKKEHKCCECCAPIKPGNLYQYASGVWQGDPAGYKTCIQCAEIRDEAESKNDGAADEGPALSYLAQWIVDSEMDKELWCYDLFERLAEHGHPSWKESAKK